MPTFYLDYEGGSDAADGTTFANRWKTITAGPTAARIAPGDTIRVMGSPAPTSLGINATWTTKSPTVTLASALNALITNCDSVWTASANVTATADTAVYRTSTGSAKLAIAGAFTTGLAAYFATGTLNLSAYQGITLWVRVSAVLAASTLSIRLCSDTAGVTTVNTLAIPAISKSGQWVPIHIDTGGALGASIASIALYADLDPGAIDVSLDNISTTKAVGNDCLTLVSLIGKNTSDELWWALRGINGTTLTIDVVPTMAVADTSRGYWGTTESVTTYKRETIKTDLGTASTSVQLIQDSGSTGNLITFSGGWDRTAMTTQNLETWFDGRSGVGYGLGWNAKTFIYTNLLNFVRYDYGILVDGGSSSFGTVKTGHCQTAGLRFTAATSTMTATELVAYGCNAGGLSHTGGSDWTITTLRLITAGNSITTSGWVVANSERINITTMHAHNNNYYGINGSGASLTYTLNIGTLNVHDNGQSGLDVTSFAYGWEIGTINADRNGVSGVALRDGCGGTIRIGTLNAASNSTYGLNLAAVSDRPSIVIGSLVTTGNTTASVNLTVIYGDTQILKSSLAEATKVTVTSASNGRGYIRFQNFNNTTNDHRTYYGSGAGGATIFSETTVRHTASGIAWKISPLGTVYVTALVPVRMPLARVAVNASALVTVKVWMRRTNTGLTGTLICRGMQIAGVASDVTDTIGAAIDTWEEQTITFTPSAAGVVEIHAEAYGGSTYSLYVDDFTVTQA